MIICEIIVHLFIDHGTKYKKKKFVTVFVDRELPIPPAGSGSLLHSALVAMLHIFMRRSAYGCHVVLGCDGTRTGLDVVLRRLFPVPAR